MNGKKKIETIQKEFTAKFPYLTLVFLDEAKSGIEGTKTLAEVRKSKGEDVSIMASQKVNSLEKKFLKNYGLIVEVAYQKEGQLILTDPNEEKTLNELNSWCAANGCIKIDYKKTKTDPSEINDLVSIGSSEDDNESDNETNIFSDDFIDQALAEHNAHEDGFDVDFNESEIDPVLEIVKDKLVEYNSDIIVNPSRNSNSISFKLPFVSNDDKSLLILSLDQGKYQMKFQCYDENLVKELVSFKPDVIKKTDSGVKKDDLCKNEGELLSAVVDFICLLSRLNMDIGDGKKIHYVGYNKYSKEINGVGQFQVSGDKEASIFSIYDNQEIGTQKWMRLNLQTSFFRNGELIQQARTEAEWLWATENKVPAWCYYNQDPANGTKYGYLYNWYAINDPRGLAPKGWQIPSQQDYQKLLDYFKAPAPGVSIELKSAGYRSDPSTFNFIDQIGFWWTSDEVNENARFATFAEDRSDLSFGAGLKSLGLSVICIAESLISKGLQELIDEGIAVNLYRNPKMYEDEVYFSESELQSTIKESGSMFLDHLYALPFKSYTEEVVDKVFKFLDKQLNVDYKSLMFKPGMHHPVIGIFNAKSNELLGVGIGRKNRIFFVSTVESINDQNYRTFSKFDHCNVIGAIVNILESAADAQLGIMEAIDDGDSESEEDYSETLDKEIDNLLIAYPYLPNSIADLSPGDF